MLARQARPLRGLCFARCRSRKSRAAGRAASRTAFAGGAAFGGTMRGSGAGRRGGSAIRGSRARWSTAAVCRVSRSTLGGGFGSALRGSAAATGCRSAPACFVRAGFGSAFGGGAAATGRLRSGACFGPFSLGAGFVSALRGTVASTGGSGLVWVAVTDGAAGGFGASPAAAERSPAGAGLVWFAVTEDLDSGLRSSDAKAGRSTPACLAWPSGGAGFGLCSVGAATTGRSAAGAGFARLSTGAGLGSDFGGSTAATGRSAEGFGVAAATTGCSTAGAGLAWFTAGGSAGFAFEGSAAAAGRSTVGARFARLSTDGGVGLGSGFGGSTAATGRSADGAGLAWFTGRRRRRLRLRRLGGGGRALTRRGLFRLVVRWWRRWFRFGLRRRGRHDRLLGGRCRLRLVHRRRQRRHRLRRLGGCASALNPGRRGGRISACARLRRGLWGCGRGDWPFTERFGLRPGVCRGRLRLCFRRRDRSDGRPASGTLLPGIFRKEVRAPVLPARLLSQGAPRLRVVPPGVRLRPAATGPDARPLHSRPADSRPRPAASAQPSAAPRPESPDRWMQPADAGLPLREQASAQAEWGQACEPHLPCRRRTSSTAPPAGSAGPARPSPAGDARRQAIGRRAHRQAQTTKGLPGAACRPSNETILYACRPHTGPRFGPAPGYSFRIFTAYLPYWLVLSESNRALAGNQHADAIRPGQRDQLPGSGPPEPRR